jgi:ankyrin repeat protein
MGGEKSAAGVRYLLSVNEGAVRVPNAAGELPLHRACRAGAGVEVLQCLLDAFPGAATALSDDLMSPLHHAAAGQAPKPSVELLLAAFPAGAKAAASAKTKKDGYLPLHFAVEKTTRVRPGAVKVLLDAFPEAAQVQTKKHHRYPLYLAAAGAPPRVLEWLIKANPAALEAKELEHSCLPLHWAVVNAKTAGTCSIAVLVNAWKEGAAQPEKNDNLPLHYVRAGTAAASTEILLRANPAAVDAANNSGRLPLHFAASTAAPKTSVALLLNEAAARTPDKDKSLPLHLAVTENQHDVVQLLLDSFPQGVECVDKNNQTPLKRCFDGSSRGDTVKLLIQQFPKVRRAPLFFFPAH